jgi:hypothetical protein
MRVHKVTPPIRARSATLIKPFLTEILNHHKHLLIMVSLMEPLGNAMPNKYGEELIRTARAIAAPGKGILAADESTGTIGKRVSRWY